MAFSIENKFIIFDGAMGTMLFENGLLLGELPETYNLIKPEVVANIHKAYIDAGADIITANTFGANLIKYKNSKFAYEDVIKEGIKIAKNVAGDKPVALDVGSIGQLMKPLGSLTFTDAYNIFKNQMIIGEENGANLILIETISDLYEAKTAILAAKENTQLPVLCTMTFQNNGRTLTGTDPITAVATLQGLGIDAIGVNCSLGPNEMIPIIDEILKYSNIPVIAQPNRGIPKADSSGNAYDVTVEDFVKSIRIMADKGVHIFGGCCGTTPLFTKAIKEELKEMVPKVVKNKDITTVSSYSKTVIVGEGLKTIGERINPTGRKVIKEALVNKNYDFILEEAINQKNAGADILDVNVGVPGIKETEIMKDLILRMQEIINTPLQVDSQDAQVIEEAVRIYNGKPLINSVNGSKESLEKILPIVKKYGCTVIGLTLDEDGIPDSAEKRVEIAEKIINKAKEYGIPKRNIIIDTLVVSVSVQQKEVMESLKAIKIIKEQFNVPTALGISNISYGMPKREILNTAYTIMALSNGLDLPIINPMSKEIMDLISSYKVLSGQDKDSKEFLKRFANVENQTINEKEDKDFTEIILDGLIEQSVQKTKEMLIHNEPLDIIENYIVPALNIAGEKYEKGEFFLPQLMQSAEAVKASFDLIKNQFSTGFISDDNKILLATVKGDIHDIGKNIVKMLLQSYGFSVIDLGKDVSKEEIANEIKACGVRLIGLSSLMTTTLNSMKETINFIKSNFKDVKIIAGGAVLTEEYAKSIGADYYAKDALQSVRIAKAFFNREEVVT